ncbi:MAG: VapE domain-containing protein [Synechococcus sp.]
MKKAAMAGGLGEDSQLTLGKPADHLPCLIDGLDRDSPESWTATEARDSNASEPVSTQGPNPSGGGGVGGGETTQAPLALHHEQVRNAGFKGRPARSFKPGDWIHHVTKGLGEVRRIPSVAGAEGVAVEVRFQGQSADATVACVELQKAEAPRAGERDSGQCLIQLGQLAADSKTAKIVRKATAASADGAIAAKAIRLTPAQVMKRLQEEVGILRLDTRSQEITAGGVTMSGNAIARLYLQLSSSAESWPKEATYDAAVLLAEQNAFDPVADYLNGNTAAPLPMEQWQRLDQCLLGIDDPIAAAFLPRYLIAAVAKTFEPGCDFRQTPVMVGPQWIGKTALGRILFGAQHFISGVGDLGKDALERCHTAWGIELAELDGITRRSDQEALKAFLSETSDSWRSPYDKATERRPRRFLFWGTSNGAALRDTTGNTRFVCIPVEQPLPLDWAEQNRAAIWSRAVEQYRAGVSWQECDAAERSAIADRNDNYQEQDPWLPVVMQHLEHSAAEQRLPVQVPELLTRIGMPRERQGTREAKRVQQLAESLGWLQDRRQVGGKRQKGLWPAATPVPHQCHTSKPQPAQRF